MYLIILAQCLPDCADCSTATTDRVGEEHTEIDTTCNTCAERYVKVTTILCYSKENLHNNYLTFFFCDQCSLVNLKKCVDKN